MPSACPPVSQRPSCTAMQTTHAALPADAAAILADSISLHCQATGARMLTANSTGMGIGSLQHLVGPDAATGIALCAAGSATTHLGIFPSTDPDAAARTLYTDFLQRLDRRIARWSGFRLSLLGRAHVAKQVLVSMFAYHGTFISVPADIPRQLCPSLHTFMAANRPAAAGAAPLLPSRAISTRTLQQGGIAVVYIPAQLTALQAKIIGRMLEHKRVPRKAAGSPCTTQQSRGLQPQHSPSTCGSWAGGYPSPIFPLRGDPGPAARRGLLGSNQTAAPPQAGQPRAFALLGGHGATPVPQQADHIPIFNHSWVWRNPAAALLCLLQTSPCR